MLLPKKTKYRKMQRGRMKGKAKSGSAKVMFGEYGLQATEPCWLSDRQIESARITMSRRMKKGGELFLRVFPDKPISKKPAETRMGKGKGAPEFWVCVVKRDKVLFEVKGLDLEAAKDILLSARYKLPIKTKFVSKQEIEQNIG